MKKKRFGLIVVATLVVSAGIGPVISRLRDLQDVRIAATPSSGQVLSWNGTRWTNAAAAVGSGGTVGLADFNSNQFSTNNGVSIKSGALQTNLTVRNFTPNGVIPFASNNVAVVDGSLTYDRIVQQLAVPTLQATTVAAASSMTLNGSPVLTNQVWTNAAGVLQPSGVGANTNWIKIYPNGNVTAGEDAFAGSDTRDLKFSLLEKKDDLSFQAREVHELVADKDDSGSYYDAFVSSTNGAFSRVQWNLEPNASGGDELSWQVNGKVLLDVWPTVADGSSAIAYTYDTLNYLSTPGSLLAVWSNHQTNKVSFSSDGSLSLSGRTNRVADNGTSLTYNGTPIGGSTNVFNVAKGGHLTVYSNLTVLQIGPSKIVRTDSNTNLAAVTVGTGMSFDGTTLSRDALTGDVTTSANAATIANDAVTYAKMQNVSATARAIGRNTAGSGDPEEVTGTQILDWIGSTRGSVLYRSASGWAILAPNTAGYVLTDNGAGADPSYNAPGAGTFVATNAVQMPWTTLTMSGTNVSALNLSSGSMFKLTLTNNAYFGVPSGLPGTNLAQTIQIHLLQDGTGTRTITMTNSAWLLSGSGASTNAVPTINTNANGVTILTFVSSPFSSTLLYGVPTAFAP